MFVCVSASSVCSVRDSLHLLAFRSSGPIPRCTSTPHLYHPPFNFLSLSVFLSLSFSHTGGGAVARGLLPRGPGQHRGRETAGGQRDRHLFGAILWAGAGCVVRASVVRGLCVV